MKNERCVLEPSTIVDDAIMTKGGVLLPRHCSYRLDLEVILCRGSNRKERTSLTRAEKQRYVVALQCHRPGVAWRGLYPLFFQAPSSVIKKVVKLLCQRYSSSGMRIEPSLLLSILSDSQDGNETLSHHCRVLRHSPLFYILPPSTQEIDYYFSGRLIHNEHLFLQAQTLAAWYATLGGGYFLCHRLSTAIELARRQRRVAEWMGDEGMADRCTLNEAYNYLHAGHFRIALSMLNALQASAHARQDSDLWAMCKTARLFGRRMRRAGKQLISQASSVDDDYQRIRIVERL